MNSVVTSAGSNGSDNPDNATRVAATRRVLTPARLALSGSSATREPEAPAGSVSRRRNATPPGGGSLTHVQHDMRKMAGAEMGTLTGCTIH